MYELYEYCIKHLHGIASTHSSSLKDLHSFDVFAEPVCGFKDKGGLGIHRLTAAYFDKCYIEYGSVVIAAEAQLTSGPS